jgi:hypothetical protein
MHLLYCDETNLEERSGDFLIYGGVVVSAEQALKLSNAVDEIRATFGVDPSFRLKFNPGPEHLDHKDFIALKQAIVEAAIEHGARLVAYVILHDIATNPDEARRNGINVVCYHFDCILNRIGGAGLVLIDRFNDAGNQIEAHLSEKFSIGLKGLPYSATKRLTNIVGFHYSAVGQSHFPSIVDIVLGSLRFAINAHTRKIEKNLETASTLLGLIGPMFWREKDNFSVSELGLLFSPKIIKSDRYREIYQSLKDYLQQSGIETEQMITADRPY